MLYIRINFVFLSGLLGFPFFSTGPHFFFPRLAFLLDFFLLSCIIIIFPGLLFFSASI